MCWVSSSFSCSLTLTKRERLSFWLTGEEYPCQVKSKVCLPPDSWPPLPCSKQQCHIHGWCCMTCFTSAVKLIPYATTICYPTLLEQLLTVHFGSSSRFSAALKTRPPETQRDVTFSISEALINTAVFNTPKGHSTIWNLFPDIKNRTWRINKCNDANWDGRREKLHDPLTSMQHTFSLWNTAWENQLHSFYFKCRRIPWVSTWPGLKINLWNRFPQPRCSGGGRFFGPGKRRPGRSSRFISKASHCAVISLLQNSSLLPIHISFPTELWAWNCSLTVLPQKGFFIFGLKK